MQIKIPKITTTVTDRPPRVVPVIERGSKWSENVNTLKLDTNMNEDLFLSYQTT